MAPYHHGNLKDELLQVAIQLGRYEGPDAVTIRQVTRIVGVSPTAAYRHFADQAELLNAVSRTAMAELVKTLSQVLDDHETYPLAADRMLACANAYLKFGLEEPHFFRCLLAGGSLNLISSMGGDTPDEESPQDMYLLSQFAQCFETHARQTDGTGSLEYFFQNALAAWSTIHGITVLCTTGHMANLSREEKFSLAVPVFASALRGTDFKDPHNPYRNYPGSVAPTSDES